MASGKVLELREHGAVFGDGPWVELLSFGIGSVLLGLRDEFLHPLVKCEGRFVDVLLSRIEAVQGCAQLLPCGLPFKLIGEDVNRILNGLHVVLNALVQTHQKGPFVTVQRTTDFDALAVLVPPISWHRHTESFPPFDTPKLEGCNGATFGLGRTEEKDGDVHELGRRD